jgi:adenylyl-sulfate kinase
MNPWGLVIWLTGMSGAGKSTLAHLLKLRFLADGRRVEVLDGDFVRAHFGNDLGFSKEDRDENIRRIAFLCELLAKNGVHVIVAAISPYRKHRDQVREKVPHFAEIHVDCPLDVLVQRDTKGLYKRALAGEIPHFTGISDPYERPLDPEVRICSSKESAEQSLDKIWDWVAARLANPLAQHAISNSD